MKQLKNLTTIFLCLILTHSLVYGMGHGNKKKQYSARVIEKKGSKSSQIPVFMVDDFEHRDALNDPEWWRFGNLYLTVEPTMKEKGVYLGNQSLRLNGATERWYVGGTGVYLGLDASEFNTLKMVVYSKGYNSGILKIELYDDDNSNAVVDMDKMRGIPSEDDIWTYHLMLDWEGWKVVSIPLTAFKDSNPLAGDNVWNPYQSMGSIGLIQMQFIVTTAKEAKGDVESYIDVIKFVGL